MQNKWTKERIDQFLTPDESGFSEIEAGLRSSRPMVRLTPEERRCIHSYYTMSPLSSDMARLLYFEYDDLKVNRSQSKPISGTVMVAEADGSNPEPVMDMPNASVCQGAMQQWIGPTHRVGCIHLAEPRWWVAKDLKSGQEWRGQGHGREFSPDGEDLYLQTPEQIHLYAEAEGKTLTPDQVAARIIDFRTKEEKVRISVADVLEVHPQAEEARKQHMCFKQTLFSPTGDRISFNFSNAWYSSHRPEERRHEKFIARRDGSEIRCLGSGASHPSWHPTGEYYFSIASDELGVHRFMLYTVDGSAPERLGADWVAGGHPSFQPGEGRYLAVDYPRTQDGYVFLRLYDLESLSFEDILVAEYTDYSNESGTHFHPAWSPDGKRLFISSAHTGVTGVFQVDLF